MSRRAVSFDETGFQWQGEVDDGVLLWLTPNGDGLCLFQNTTPPGIDADLNDLDGLRAFYRRSVTPDGLGVIEIDTVVVDGCPAVRTLFKVAQEPSGRTYFGALTLPFRDFSYVLNVQCEEHGVTGQRDMVVWTMLTDSGEAGFDEESEMMTRWLDDPYDPTDVGPMTRNKSERPEYDAQFPDHPLSRARAMLDHLERTGTIDPAIKKQAGFAWKA